VGEKHEKGEDKKRQLGRETEERQKIKSKIEVKRVK
jgi:hypothetical protein